MDYEKIYKTLIQIIADKENVIVNTKVLKKEVITNKKES